MMIGARQHRYIATVVPLRVGDVSEYAKELGGFTQVIINGRTLWHCSQSGLDYYPEAVQAMWERERELDERSLWSDE